MAHSSNYLDLRLDHIRLNPMLRSIKLIEEIRRNVLFNLAWFVRKGTPGPLLVISLQSPTPSLYNVYCRHSIHSHYCTLTLLILRMATKKKCCNFDGGMDCWDMIARNSRLCLLQSLVLMRCLHITQCIRPPSFSALPVQSKKFWNILITTGQKFTWLEWKWQLLTALPTTWPWFGN